MYRVNRLNQRTAPLRTAVDSGHSPYDRPPPTRPDDVRWQLPPCQPSGPEHDAAVVFAHLAAAQKALEAAETAALDAIELDADRLKRKRRTVGKPGVPETAP